MARDRGASATVAKVWDAATGEELLALDRAPGRSPEANAVALSRDGSRLAACVGANRVEVWDVTTRKRLAAVEADPLAGCVGITPDGALLAAAGVRHHRVRTWDVASGKELDVYGGYRRRVRALVFSADGQTMVTGDGSGAATVWDMPGGKRIHTLNAVDSPVTSVAVSRGASVVAMGGLKGEAVLWDLAADPPRETQRLHGSGAAAVALRPDGAMLASASARLDLWPDSASTTARGGRDRYAWGGDLRVNASGTRALTTHGNGAVTLWDTERGASLATFATPAASEEPIPNALGSWRVFTGFTADGSAFRIVHHTGAVLVCDAATGEIRGTFAIGPLYT